VKAEIVHLTSETINRYDPVWGASLLGDKSNSVIFDNSKIKRFVPAFKAMIPFHRGAREIVDWHLGDEARIQAGYDPNFDAQIDRMIAENK
jgi:hypothetical protein